ncbi:MAG: tetratricopeptide repeat protein [Sphingomonadales bacterium]|nr:tetratricopeptide repeat protein [Sphingomonadales bacterium]
MMLKLARTRPLRGALFVALLASAAPALAQSAPTDPDARLRKIEAEVRALQRQVFPGSDGKFFTPQVTPGGPATGGSTPVPATTPVTDLLTRMDSVEAQIARLTAQSEETANRVAQLEARLTALAPPAAAPGTALPEPGSAAPSGTGPAGASGALPAATVPAPVAVPPAAAALTPAASKPTPAPKPAVVAPSGKPAGVAVSAAPKPAPAAKPSPARVAAVAKIVKPDTGKPGDDEYSYGFRLWEAKFYPEAQQQLRLYIDKYPRDAKISFGRNLLGRAFLDDGKPRDAAPWFLKNYQSDKKGARAAESLLYLAESMRQLGDTSRACIALAEFADTYPAETTGRLKGLYETTRKAVTCD